MARRVNSMRLKFDIVGIDEAIARVDKMDVETRIAVRGQVKKSSLRLARRMRNKVPVKKGKLKKSIKSKFSPDGLSSDVGPTYGRGSHAHLIEFGHYLVIKGKIIKRVEAQPFITPSREEEKPKYVSEMKQAIKSAVKK